MLGEQSVFTSFMSFIPFKFLADYIISSSSFYSVASALLLFLLKNSSNISLSSKFLKLVSAPSFVTSWARCKYKEKRDKASKFFIDVWLWWNSLKAYIREQAEFLYKPRHNLLGFFDNINSETAGSKNGLWISQ